MPDDHIKRCDVRVPIELYNEIEKIAVEEYNAPLYHKTGKPQVSSTIIELLKLGIENLRGEVSDKESDTLSDKVRELESQIEQIRATSLSDNKSDTVPDTHTDDRIKAAIGEAIPKAIANLKSDEEFIRAIALEVQKVSTNLTDSKRHLRKNDLEQAEIELDEETATRIDKASLSPIFDESENEKTTTQKQLANTTSMSAKEEQSQIRIELGSTEEAYKLAQSRGFKGKLASFRSNIGREKYAQQYREDYGIIRVGQRNESQYFNVWREN